MGCVGLVCRCRFGRASAVAHRFADFVKVGDGHQTAGAVQGIAGLVPLLVVFAADDVQEVARGETEEARVGRGVGRACVVVECFYDLCRRGAVS